MALSSPKTCWIVTEGLAGTENQCIGVAEALGIPYEIKRVTLRQPWKLLSPWLGFETARAFSPPLLPPWPRLLITSGRKSIAAARYIRKRSGGKTVTLHLQDPKIPASAFDLVAVPAHDSMRGDNVIVTTGAPNRVTHQRMDQARARFAEFGQLPGPRVAVLIGGTSKAYRMTAAVTEKLAAQLKELPGGLMVTASRRTGEENRAILERALSGAGAYIWDGNGENPYFGMLAQADYILITADSVSMISDAATTGKPVYIIPLEGGNAKFARFHANILRSGAARWFEGRLESWTYTPLRDASAIADIVRKRLG